MAKSPKQSRPDVPEVKNDRFNLNHIDHLLGQADDRVANEWEDQFINDLVAKMSKDELKCLSERQYECLKKIANRENELQDTFSVW